MIELLKIDSETISMLKHYCFFYEKYATKLLRMFYYFNNYILLILSTHLLGILFRLEV